MRDALIGLIKCLVLNKSNCRPLIEHVNCLVDLITLAHLHQGRALPNTKTNVIEAGPNQKFREEKDWYYNIEKENEKSERVGPVTFSEVSLKCHYHLIVICKRKKKLLIDDLKMVKQWCSSRSCGMRKKLHHEHDAGLLEWMDGELFSNCPS